MVSGAYSMFFAIGETLGPMSGSLLNAAFGDFKITMAVIAGLFVLFLPFAVYAFVVTPTKAHKSRDLTHGLLEKDADPDPDTRDQENTTTEKDSTFVAINEDQTT